MAGALFNYCQEGHPLKLPGDGDLKLIDYQFPLKARQNDKGIGKVDLFGVINQIIPCIIELKVDQDGGGEPDTPLRAILEGLTYCAIVEANQEAISREASSKFGLSLQSQALALVVLGPRNYWDFFIDNVPAGPWQDAIRHLATKVSKVQIPSISLLSIQDFNSDPSNPQNLKPQAQLQYPF